MFENLLDKESFLEKFEEFEKKIGILDEEKSKLTVINDPYKFIEKSLEICSWIYCVIVSAFIYHEFFSGKKPFWGHVVLVFASLYLSIFTYPILLFIYIFIEKPIDRLLLFLYKVIYPKKYNGFVYLNNKILENQNKIAELKLLFKKKFDLDLMEFKRLKEISYNKKDSMSSNTNMVSVSTQKNIENKNQINDYESTAMQVKNLRPTINVNKDESNDISRNSVSKNIVIAKNDTKKITKEIDNADGNKVITNRIDELYFIDSAPIQINLFDQFKANRTGQKRVYNNDNEAQSQFNSSLGILGEEFIFLQEKNKLIEFNMPHLAELVKHVSKEIGDGLGYDIISFDKNSNQIYIEVKTTTYGSDSDFFISENEYDKLKNTSNYYIYRIYDFDIAKKEGSYFIINGINDFEKYFDKKPINFRVSLKSHTHKKC